MSKIPIKIDGFPQFDVCDRNHVRALVDGEYEVFGRSDQYGGHPMSGLASFGPVQGDHRMIGAIASDVKEMFEALDKEIERINQ